jgi:hypothetical protein
MASEEPCEEEQEPQRSDRPPPWNPVVTRWWPRVRFGLALIEIAAEARENVALACGARAIVLLGNAVLRTGTDS